MQFLHKIIDTIPIYVCYAIIVVCNAQALIITNALFVQMDFINGMIIHIASVIALLWQLMILEITMVMVPMLEESILIMELLEQLVVDVV